MKRILLPPLIIIIDCAFSRGIVHHLGFSVIRRPVDIFRKIFLFFSRIILKIRLISGAEARSFRALTRRSFDAISRDVGRIFAGTGRASAGGWILRWRMVPVNDRLRNVLRTYIPIPVRQAPCTVASRCAACVSTRLPVITHVT